MSTSPPEDAAKGGLINGIVRAFLDSNLSIVLVILACCIGLGALLITPREEDPQIIVPLADVHVYFPGHPAREVEQLVAAPLERILSQIDGVEYVYSTSRTDTAIITVRYYVGEDRERSLVKLFKKLDEHRDLVPEGTTWVVKPIEIDDVPIVTLTLTSSSADGHALRRMAEEMAERLARVPDLSRAYVVGGEPRQLRVELDPERMESRGVGLLDVERAIRAANQSRTAGAFTRLDQVVTVETAGALADAAALAEVVVAVARNRPVFLRDVATVRDGASEVTSYTRHAWGPAFGFVKHAGAGGTRLGQAEAQPHGEVAAHETMPAVTIALSKKKGANSVLVAEAVLEEAEDLRRELLPGTVEVAITRNSGLTADEKVNELVEALGVAIIIVIALLTFSLGWREATIVAVAVPVVFGLTLAINQLAGYSINRVTLFALILSLGLLVDDPIVDVENISRHFALRKRASRRIVLEAVAEIRPPLISATLAVMLSFVPMFFITGMMGPYMAPMALNVPVTMAMSMLVAFTITPWLSYHMLKGRYRQGGGAATEGSAHQDEEDLDALRKGRLWRFFYPLMAPMLSSRRRAWGFLLVIAALTVAACTLAALRLIPLKMLPFDNKNELLLVLDLDEGTTLERTDAAVRDYERYLLGVPEVADVTSYVGIASPMDFNGMVRHYYLRRGENVAEVRVNLVGKRNRSAQSHSLGLRLRPELDAISARHGVRLKLVETPPGPPVIQTLVAEVYGGPRQSYEDLIAAAGIVRERMSQEPGVVDVDDTVEAASVRKVFRPDREKAALHGITVEEIARTLEGSLGGLTAGPLQVAGERNPLSIVIRLPRPLRSSPEQLAGIRMRARNGELVPLGELGRFEDARVEQAIYHKNLEPVVYVFADTAGRAPAEAILDIQADLKPASERMPPAAPRQLAGRTFLRNGSGIFWRVPDGIRLAFSGEGEWNITIDVFRDLGLAFAGASLAIYILLIAQTGSFAVPLVVMLAIPLTALGVMPGFWILNLVAGGQVGAYADPIFFTATGMIGMIALSGIVTRDSIILVDFIHLSLRKGHNLFDAIMASRVVRLRPILLTAGAATLSALPITIDPIFSGLAWSLIFGLIASTVFTLFVIPVAYWLLYADKPGHGLPVEGRD